MTTLIKKLTKFLEPNQQSQLEQFINSKQPTNAAEVEYWTKQYEQSHSDFVWARGF